MEKIKNRFIGLWLSILDRNTISNRIARWFLFSIVILILISIFILATPAILGEKPILMDEEHFSEYPVYSINEYEDSIVFLIDKNGTKTQFQLKRENVKFGTDFNLKKPVLFVYEPEYFVLKNLFYSRKKYISKEEKGFKKILNELNKNKKEYFLFKYIENE